LAAGTYTATLTVAGDHAISQSVDLSFEVTTPPSGSTYAITLDQSILYQTTPYDFGTEMVGYAPLTPLTATVTNTGTQPTGALAVSLSGTDANAFSISADNVSGSGLALGASGTFAVAPKTGLAAGTYNATVTVSGANVTTQSFEVSFIVSPITPASAPVITPSSLPSGIIGSPYTATLAASNSPTSWVIVGGTLPLGLTLNTTSGEIAGTPLGPVGTSSFTVTASNGTGTSASVQFNILISPPPGGGSGATPSIPALNPAMLMLLALMLAITAAFRTAPRVTRNKKR
ncbi:MAG: Ig domain-containing protein, partial [Betaproteobacteria bacterium]|nr:Ig domain-containing protein [Betaproteobacteria bacterium]